MEFENKKRLIITCIIGILFLIYLYISSTYIWNHGLLSVTEVNQFNVWKKFIQDFLSVLIFSLILCVRFHSDLSELGFSRKSSILCLILFIIYLIFFVLHSDFSVGGMYRAVFYLLIVGFPEELVMRGYIYLRLKPINRVLAIIISGVLFGVGHSILPGIVAGQSLLSIGVSMLSEIGYGISMGFVFISYMELSNNILVAILIHAILDYSYGYYGVLVSVITMGYLLYKHRFHKVENLDKLII